MTSTTASSLVVLLVLAVCPATPVRAEIPGGALAAPVGAPAGAASAKERAAEAKRHFAQGKEHFRARAFREALAQFQAAYRLWPDRVIHFNIALALARLGRSKDAVSSVFRYLEGATAKERLLPEELESLLRAHGLLEVHLADPTLAIWVDGRPRGSARDLRLVVGTGRYAVELRRGDRVVARRTMAVAGGQVTTWTVGVEGAPGVAAGGAVRTVETRTAPRSKRGVHRAAFASFTALAAAGAGAALGLYVQARSVNDRFLADRTRGDLRELGLRLQHSTNAMVGLAAASALTAAVLAFFTRWRNERGEGRISAGGVVTRRGAMFAVRIAGDLSLPGR